MNTCPICLRPCPRRICTLCIRNYEKRAHEDGSMHEAMVWAADRARYFERRRLATRRSKT